MRLAIDTHYFEEGFGGIQSFIEWILSDKVLEEILKENDIEKYLFFYNRTVNFKDVKSENLNFLSKNNFPNTKISKISKSFKKIYWFFWFNFILPVRVKKYKIDIFLSPNHFLPLLKCAKKEVVVVHDFAWQINSKWKNLGYRIYAIFFQKMSLARANKILVISQSTKKDLQKFYSVPENKIFLLKPKTREIFKPRKKTDKKVKEVQKKYNLPQNFILFVGQIEERKNIPALLEMINRLKNSKVKELINLKLVIVGNVGPGGKKYLNEIKNNKNILWFRNVVQDDLPYFYNLAKIFFMPSFYEGLCFPVLEAINSGIPVITSNTSSFPEVIGNNGIMFSSNDYNSFCEAIKKKIIGKD